MESETEYPPLRSAIHAMVSAIKKMLEESGIGPDPEDCAEAAHRIMQRAVVPCVTVLVYKESGGGADNERSTTKD